MSENAGSGAAIHREVTETIRERQMGVKVKKVVHRRDGHERHFTEVYTKESMGEFNRLDGEGSEEVEHWKKIAELEGQHATEVLFGLAEAHGYELEAK